MEVLVQDIDRALMDNHLVIAHSGILNASVVLNCEPVHHDYKRRRGVRGSVRSISLNRGTVSEASDSSIQEENIQDCICNTANVFTDSDELEMIFRPRQRLTVSAKKSAHQIESDSVAENLSPMRPHRRRRRYKHMSIDSVKMLSTSDSVDQKTRWVSSAMGSPSSAVMNASGDCCSSGVYPTMPSCCKCGSYCCMASVDNTPQTVCYGKRKWASRGRVEELTTTKSSVLDIVACDMDLMEVCSDVEESSVSSSDVDSDYFINADNDREADDEQSDFFLDSDISSNARSRLRISGVPIMQHVRSAEGGNCLQYDSVLSGAFSNMSMASNVRHRIVRTFSTGRRKLKEDMPRYTMTRFLEDRQRWKCLQQGSPGNGQYTSGTGIACGGNSSEHKRFRQTPPLPTDSNDDVGAVAM